MNADEYILQLPHIDLKSRDLLPELLAIYYVLDETFIIWYIGQAKNLRARWTGKSHHRLHQLLFTVNSQQSTLKTFQVKNSARIAILYSHIVPANRD